MKLGLKKQITQKFQLYNYHITELETSKMRRNE